MVLWILVGGFCAGVTAAAIFDEMREARWVIVEEIERVLSQAGVSQKEAAYQMYQGFAAPVQWSRAKTRGPIDLARIAKLPTPLASTVLRRIADRLDAGGVR